MHVVIPRALPDLQVCFDLVQPVHVNDLVLVDVLVDKPERPQLHGVECDIKPSVTKH